MASKVRTTAGSTLGISTTAPATYDDTGFSALSFDLIADITELGEFGRTYNLVTHNPIADRRTVKRKGSFNDGAITMQLGRDGTDVGQIAARAALDDDDSAYFALTTQDGTILYFSAQVMSFTYNMGNVDSITAGAITLEIDFNILEIAP